MQLVYEATEQPDGTDVTVVLPQHPWYSYTSTLKRLLDFSVAALVLLATLPIWLAIAVAIKVDSPGRAIFMQERVGLRGRRFRFFKFRSMTDGADRMKADMRHLSEVDGPVFKVRSDPRVTRIGRLLRRTSLDELPQLINVLKGEMSLVGPRPAVPEEVAQYRPNDMVRLAVKPGLTCWWQVRGRSTVDFDTWMAYDREYVYGLSFWTDVRILVRTVKAVLSCRGAF
ncbi:MAG TPA: sugar transferase [Candidatus Dormibacteraeota bacterium]|nr:sugar transferase [Candidatus Dormibacteraeota bacterium]